MQFISDRIDQVYKKALKNKTDPDQVMLKQLRKDFKTVIKQIYDILIFRQKGLDEIKEMVGEQALFEQQADLYADMMLNKIEGVYLSQTEGSDDDLAVREKLDQMGLKDADFESMTDSELDNILGQLGLF